MNERQKREDEGRKGEDAEGIGEKGRYSYLLLLIVSWTNVRS